MREEHLSPQGSHAQGHASDHRRDRRDHRGAGGGVHSERPADRQRRRHLPAVRPHHRPVDGVLGVSGAVVHAGAVRHAAAPRSICAATSSSTASTVPTSACASAYVRRVFQSVRARAALDGGLRGACWRWAPCCCCSCPAASCRRRTRVTCWSIVQLPAGATLPRTREVMTARSAILTANPADGERLRHRRVRASPATARTSAAPSCASSPGTSARQRPASFIALGQPDARARDPRCARLRDQPADDPRPGRVRRFRFLSGGSRRPWPRSPQRRPGDRARQGRPQRVPDQRAGQPAARRRRS